MTRKGHDLKKVIACLSEIVQGTVTEIVKGEAHNFRFLAGRLKAMPNFIKR
jgi:hypothetical protein